MSEMLDPSPTVIWFPSLATAQPDSNGTSHGSCDEHHGKARHPHAKRPDRTRRAEDERARLIRLIG
ncbi:MAG: hypothetical protein JWM77_933 [Rhodospirillales bacterium]|nr:hypothetical protein [Rhodospirillales bacterium]